MTFGGVPISVTNPPRIVAKESGIRVGPADRFAFLAVWMSTGISSTSVATLFMRAEGAAPMPPMTAMWAPSGREASIRVRVTSETAPEFVSPRGARSGLARVAVRP